MTNSMKGKIFIGIATMIGIAGFVSYAILKTGLSQLGQMGSIDRFGKWLDAKNTLQTVGGQEALLNTWIPLTLIGTIVFGGGALIIGIIYMLKKPNNNSNIKKEGI